MKCPKCGGRLEKIVKRKGKVKIIRYGRCLKCGLTFGKQRSP
ncbi:MAG: hypothetical protein NDF53_03430 [archaeon GB-1867-097]|nr:hypothetical protein [Candidatus Culexmicrobium thermophilum]